MRILKQVLVTTWVHNMSKRKLSEAEKKVLSRGPRFAVTPNALDFAAPIEAAMQSSNAPPLRIESARLRICNALSKVQKPRSNISTEEWKAMKGQEDQDNSSRLEIAWQCGPSVLPPPPPPPFSLSLSLSLSKTSDSRVAWHGSAAQQCSGGFRL